MNSLGIYNEKLNRLLKILLWPLSIVVLCLTIKGLNRGLIFSDEGYYLDRLMNPEKALLFGSDWVSFSGFFRSENIGFIRLKFFVSHILSVLFLNWSLSKYFKQSALKQLPIVVLLAIIFVSPVLWIPNYFRLNVVFIQLCFGLLFLHEGKFKSSKKLGSFIVGLGFSVIPLVMNTNLFLIVLPVLFYLIHDKNKQAILFYSFGVLLVWGVYLCFVRSPSEFVQGVKDAFYWKSSDKTHGAGAMVLWSLESLLYMVLHVILPAIAFLFLSKKISSIISFFVALLVFGIAFFFLNVKNDYLNISDLGLILVIPVFLWLKKMENWKSLKSIWLPVITLMIIPLGSLGTNVDLSIRGSFYVYPFLIFSFYSFEKFKVNVNYLFLFVLFQGAFFSYDYFFSEGWQGYRIIDEGVELSSLMETNHDIRLNQGLAESVKAVSESIPDDGTVFISNQFGWGYMYLLKLDCPQRSFLFSKASRKVIQERIDNREDLYFLDIKRLPFTEDDIASFGTVERITETDKVSVFRKTY